MIILEFNMIEETLLSIARKLNSHHIKWVLGGSLMLYYEGIISQVNDIDILIKESDKQKVTDIFDQLGTKKEHEDSVSFKTPVFLEYVVGQIDVDVMGGLTITKGNINHYFPLKDDDYRTILIKNTVIYLDHLENWLTYYELMKREHKVKQIKSYLKNR